LYNKEQNNYKNERKKITMAKTTVEKIQSVQEQIQQLENQRKKLITRWPAPVKARFALLLDRCGRAVLRCSQGQGKTLP